jgi:long-subunit fatty acid transport protein
MAAVCADQEASSTPASTASTERRWWFGVGAFYGLTKKIQYNEASVSGVGTEYVFEVDNALTIAADVRWDASPRWGMQGGMSLDGYRKIKGYQYQILNTTISDSFTNVDSRFALILGYLNAFVRWGKLYFPFGLNIGTVHIQNPPLLMKDTKSIPGWQAGMGYAMSDRLAVEVLYRVVRFSSKQNTDPATGTVMEGKDAQMPGWLMGLKASF